MIQPLASVCRRLRLRAAAALALLPALLLTLGAKPPAPPAWRRYEACTLIEHPANDGDSFHVRAGRRHRILRLYFVDAPETAATFPERLEAQAAYWTLTPPAAQQLGKEAGAFARALLAQPFTVYTRFEDARGNSDRPRHYAMLQTADGRWLSACLVEAGLARLYGKPTALPDGTSARRYRAALRRLERQAREQGRGGWAPAAGRAAP
jgi:endonuclease YncB( thermonuclease family)